MPRLIFEQRQEDEAEAVRVEDAPPTAAAHVAPLAVVERIAPESAMAVGTAAHGAPGGEEGMSGVK